MAYSIAITAVDDGTDAYTKHQKIIRIVRQMFGYMVINDMQFGLLTSYVRTWFFCHQPEDPTISTFLLQFPPIRTIQNNEDDNSDNNNSDDNNNDDDDGSGSKPHKTHRNVFKKAMKLLKFGVLHEAFVFIFTSFAGKSFVKLGNKLTKEEKQLAIEGLQAIHIRGVMHGDVRLENIMVKENKLTGNAKELDRELFGLKRLLGISIKNS
ncbi:hypothetical protein Glove_734g13 [Diversispora epigaea]|uniref:Uncharacterized protein n=1 Tax=Diversispora epigaea TaxID=1348612 RepID=A0A397G2U9_9GLOM|nr:hypothetical protein Glove_734g13 [Diversispora epigaea]